MSYSTAIEILGLTTPKSLLQNAALAETMLSAMTARCPLRYKVAAMVVIRAAQ